MKNDYMGVTVTNFTCNGECSNCGQCCGDILPLSKSDISKIDSYLKKHKIEATPKNLLVAIDNTCPFRDEKNKKCKIYEVRPEICRVYKCDKTPQEVYKNREIVSFNKLQKSMRDLFFNDNSNAKFISSLTNMPIYDRRDKKYEKSNYK